VSVAMPGQRIGGVGDAIVAGGDGKPLARSECKCTMSLRWALACRERTRRTDGRAVDQMRRKTISMSMSSERDTHGPF
jgi:hypothetical protein